MKHMVIGFKVENWWEITPSLWHAEVSENVTHESLPAEICYPRNRDRNEPIRLQDDAVL